MGQLSTWDYVILGIAAFIAVTTLIGRMRDYQDRLLGQVRGKLEEAKAQREAERTRQEIEEKRRLKEEQDQRTRELYRERREQAKAERERQAAAARAAAESDEAGKQREAA